MKKSFLLLSVTENVALSESLHKNTLPFCCVAFSLSLSLSLSLSHPFSLSWCLISTTEAFSCCRPLSVFESLASNPSFEFYSITLAGTINISRCHSSVNLLTLYLKFNFIQKVLNWVRKQYLPRKVFSSFRGVCRSRTCVSRLSLILPLLLLLLLLLVCKPRVQKQNKNTHGLE